VIDVNKKPNRSTLAVYSGGLTLLVTAIVIALLSKQFIYGQGYEERPVLMFVVMYLLSWGGYALLFMHATKIGRERRLFWFAVGIAVLTRAVMLWSSPILENDFYRYMWDGMVVVQGINPYDVAPADYAVEDVEPDADQQDAADLVHCRINYPEVKTIYPPAAQAVYALNGLIFGWWPYGFRYTFMVVDVLIILLLLYAGKPREPGRAWAVVYMCNPLILKELYNSMHLDILCALLLTLFVIAVQRNRISWAWVCVFLAGWVKLTPFVLMAPLFFLHTLRGQWVRLAVTLAVFAAASGAMLCLMTVGATDPFAGLQTFHDEWESNASAFAVVRAIYESVGYNYAAACQGARGIFAVVYLLFLLLWWRYCRDEESVLTCAMWSLIVMFLISPVANPWYLVWLLPFLAVRRPPMLLLLMASTSMYYLSFHIMYHDQPDSARDHLQLVEYVPFYIALYYYLFNRFAGKKESVPAD
jgi:alpha-1,6-mannosyltransferase